MARSDIIDQFLTAHDLAHVQRTPIKADASFRRYERIQDGARSLILMDAPPPDEHIQPFVKITGLLREFGLSAPEIYAEDEANGLLLLEDFGEMLYTQYLQAQPDDEARLYLAATDVLLTLKQQSTPQIAEKISPYGTATLLKEVAIFSDWFLPQIMEAERLEQAAPEFLQLWQNLLGSAGLNQNVLVLRDFHADNLMWLDDRRDKARVGLLDYQDALWGDGAYDMMSVLQDARRDVAPETVAMCMEHYVRHTGEDWKEFRRRYAILGAQRNLKIIGIFIRLCVRDGKADYLHYLPRVWRLLSKNLNHDELEPVKLWLDAHVPPAARETTNFSPQAVA